MGDFDTVIVPGSPGEYIELARSQKGRLFRKQILPAMGTSFIHPRVPGRHIQVNEALANSLQANFEAQYGDIVQVPIVDDQNRHTEDPLRNLGEVIGVEHDATGVYAIIDARKPEQAAELGKTLIGASAMIDLDLLDTKSGKHVGPTLLHVAVTNRPYITKLDEFRELVACSADTAVEDITVLQQEDEVPPEVETVPEVIPEDVVIPAPVVEIVPDVTPEAEITPPAEPQVPVKEEEKVMTPDEMIAALLEHGIDVKSLQAKVNAPADTSALTAALSSVLREAGVISLSAGQDEDTIGIQDIAEAVVELSGEKLNLEKTVAQLVKEANEAKLSAATAEVEALIHAGRVLPKQKNVLIALSMEDRESFDALVPDQVIVPLSAEGVTVHDEAHSQRYTDETTRLLDMANKLSGRKK